MYDLHASTVKQWGAKIDAAETNKNIGMAAPSRGVNKLELETIDAKLRMPRVFDYVTVGTRVLDEHGKEDD